MRHFTHASNANPLHTKKKRRNTCNKNKKISDQQPRIVIHRYISTACMGQKRGTITFPFFYFCLPVKHGVGLHTTALHNPCCNYAISISPAVLHAVRSLFFFFCAVVRSPSEAPSVVALKHQEPQVAQSLCSHVHSAPPTAAHPEGQASTPGIPRKTHARIHTRRNKRIKGS